MKDCENLAKVAIEYVAVSIISRSVGPDHMVFARIGFFTNYNIYIHQS